MSTETQTLSSSNLAGGPVEPVQNNNQNTFDSFEDINSFDSQYDENDEQEESYEDLYASTVSSKRLQADSDNPENTITVEQNYQQQAMKYWEQNKLFNRV